MTEQATAEKLQIKSDMPAAKEQQERAMISKPPRGKNLLRWLGPALIWMLSAAGSGEVLFTPRIASGCRRTNVVFVLDSGERLWGCR